MAETNQVIVEACSGRPPLPPPKKKKKKIRAICIHNESVISNFFVLFSEKFFLHRHCERGNGGGFVNLQH